MNRVLYEYERGKGRRIDWSQEYVAYYGPRSSLFNVTPKRGPYRRSTVRHLLVLIAPNRWAPPDRKDHARLRLRHRIGHSYNGWPVRDVVQPRRITPR